MKRFTILGLLMIGLALSFTARNSVGQQKTLKEQLVGVWDLVSCDRTTANGARQPYCVNPNGVLFLDASGRYAHIIAARGRPKLTVVNRQDAPAEEFKAAAQGFAANFGTWSVNEQESTITRHYEGALLPNYEGRYVKNSVSVAGDELTLVDPNPPGGFDQGRMVTVYRRVK